jgi:hypothetical protein
MPLGHFAQKSKLIAIGLAMSGQWNAKQEIPFLLTISTNKGVMNEGL